MSLARAGEALLIAVGTAASISLVVAAVGWSLRPADGEGPPYANRRRADRREILWRSAGLTLAVALVLPWFYGTSDGDALTISGLLTEPGFAVGMLGSAIAIACSSQRPGLAALSACLALGLALWMLPRGDTYSGYEVGPGAYLAIAVSAGVLLLALAALLAKWSGTLAARRRGGHDSSG